MCVFGLRAAECCLVTPKPRRFSRQGKGLGFELVNRRSSKHLLGLRVGRSFAGEG